MLFWGILNVAVSVFFFWRIRAPLMRAYLILNYVLIVNPAFVWSFFGAAHPLFIPGDESYTLALAFMATFNAVVCGSFMLLMRALPRSQRADSNDVLHRLNDVTDMRRIVLVTVVLAGFGFVCKFGLEAMGVFRMGHGGGLGGGPFLQLLKVFAGFDILALIFLGELRQVQRRPFPMLHAVYLTLIALSLAAALMTGSRLQALVVVIVAMLGFRDWVRRYWFVVYPCALALLPMLFVVFPLLGYYRRGNVTFEDALHHIEQLGLTPSIIMTEILVTRLNYLEAVARAVDYAQSHGPNGGAVFWNNIIGVIPRLIWPGKPEIFNDSRELGHQLGLLALDDDSTSVGLQPVGEAFYEYGWLGLWVAVFQALLFALFQKKFFYPGRPVAMAIYIFATFNLLQRDGYFAVIPGLIWLLIGVSVFFYVLRLRPAPGPFANRVPP